MVAWSMVMYSVPSCITKVGSPHESETIDAQTGKARLTLVPGDAVDDSSDNESEAA